MKLRHAFTRLVTTLWINVGFIKIQLPNRIRVWSDLNVEQLMKFGVNETEVYDGLIDFITTYITDVTTVKPWNYQKSYASEKNNFTQAVLELC